MKKLPVFNHLWIMILLIGSSGLSLGSSGRGCTADVTVIVNLSCTLVMPDNATVTLSRHNPGNPPPVYDSIYIRMTDTSGIVHFTNLCNGVYDLSVTDFGYDTSTQINITITGDMTINLTLQQVRTPPPSPPGLILNDQSLQTKWNKPHFSVPVLTETWENGNFTANQWMKSGSAGGNWVIAAFGYPSPSVAFNGTPQQTNYDEFLTSKALTGLHSPVMKLNFDIYLNNIDVTHVNTIAVEVWNGTSWSVLKTYTNQGGNIVWSREHLDISSVTNTSFRIRFHAAGTNCSSINNWNIDNITISATGPPGDDPCILGYNFYLNNILIGFPSDTFYTIPPTQVIYGVTYDACVATVYDTGFSIPVCTTFTSHFLCPITNLTATAVTNAAYLTWTKPQCDTELIGYNVYQITGRNSNFHHFVPGPDSLSTYCFNLDPGLQCFDVKAKFDLTLYGFPGTFGESLPENPGPVCTFLNLDTPWPFFEPWNGGSLGYQMWTNENNWIYNPAVGNPLPSADFTWQPVMANYNSSLKSPALNASVWTCATIWLDFDYKLEDMDANGSEKMDVEVMWSNAWHMAAELVNNGSVNWTSKHLDISQAKGKEFSIRFRANGAGTQHILNWYIDNIRIYGVCASPVALKKTLAHDTINLTWNPPQCGPFGQLTCFNFDDGTFETGWAISPGLTGWLGNLFPVADSVTGNLHSFDLFWLANSAATTQDFRIDVFSQAGVLLGSSQTFQVPILPPTTFMTVTFTNDIPFSGSFYGMVRWNNLPAATNFLGFDEDGPYTSQNLAYYFDGAAFTQISIAGGNGIAGVFTERACAFVFGENKSPDSSQIIGYNVFRYDSVAGGVVNFHKLNTAMLTATNYTDIIGLDTMEAGFFKYFITALFNNFLTHTWLCESPGSDTIGIRFPLIGIEEVSGGSIMIYPNPAKDVLNVKSDFSISRIEVLNFTGQTVYTENTINLKLVRINVSNLQAGIYFVRVTTPKGIQTAKITIVH